MGAAGTQNSLTILDMSEPYPYERDDHVKLHGSSGTGKLGSTPWCATLVT